MADRKICSDKPNIPANRKGTAGQCFSRGKGVGVRAGVDIGIKKLLFGNQLTMAEINSLDKDTLRSIMMRRRRRNVSNLQGNLGNMSKAQLRQGLINDLQARNQMGNFPNQDIINN